MSLPVIDKLLEIGNKLIPNKDAQLTFEKEIRALDIENMKINKELFARIIPITFPLCVWVGVAYCVWGLVLSIVAFFKEGKYIFFEVNVPPFLMLMCGVFVTGLFGKKNIEGFFKGKNGGDKE